MITKGYLLNVSRDKHLKYVLAVSDDMRELENKIEDLKAANEEKKKRYESTLSIQEEYYKTYQKEVSNTEDSNYETKDFVTKNPIPDEIKEFVRYSEDRGSGNLYFYSDRDFEVRYWITNILGFK